MIKILVDAHYIDDFYSGASTYLKGLFNELVKFDNLEIHLAARNISRLKENFPNSKFKYVKLNSNSTFNRLFFEFPKIIKNGNYDYSHFTYFVPFVKHCKYIVTIHDLLFLDFPNQFSLKYKIGRTILFLFSALKSDILLTISDYSKKSLMRFFKIKSKKIHVTPCATINFNKEKTISKPLVKGEYLLYVSRIEHRKNHISLLKSFVDLELYKKYKLLFIGAKSEYVAEFYNFLDIQPSHIKEKISHLENVDEIELQNYYQNASLFVFPSLGEGFGIPPLEALSFRTRVVCSNVTAMEDFDFIKEYQFNPSNQEDLNNKILHTLDDLNYPFDEILKKVDKKYSWTDASKKLYLELIKN